MTDKGPKRVLRLAVGLLCLYVVSYPVLMIRGFHARDNGVVMFPSTSRFAAPGEPIGPLTIMTGRVTVWNYVYLPVDRLLDLVWSNSGQTTETQGQQ